MVLEYDALHLDLDDTVCFTRKDVSDKVMEFIEFNPKLKEEIQSLDKKRKPYQEGSPQLQQVIWDNVIRYTDFMRDADLAPWLKPHLAEFLHLLRKLRNKGIKIHATTHRGYLPAGRSITQVWLDNKGIWQYIDHLNYICSKEHPDKVQYIDATYGGKYLLVDDNPVNLKDPELLKHYEAKLLVCRGVHMFDKFDYLSGFKTFQEFKDAIHVKFKL